VTLLEELSALSSENTYLKRERVLLWVLLGLAVAVGISQYYRCEAQLTVKGDIYNGRLQSRR